MFSQLTPEDVREVIESVTREMLGSLQVSQTCFNTFICQYIRHNSIAVIVLSAHPASFARNFVSGMQSFYFSEPQDKWLLVISIEIWHLAY